MTDEVIGNGAASYQERAVVAASQHTWMEPTPYHDSMQHFFHLLEEEKAKDVRDGIEPPGFTCCKSSSGSSLA